jgi:nitrogen-specific signal transduction histidine kinase
MADLLEGAPHPIVVVDSRGRIVLASAETERIFGRPRKELVGTPLERLLQRPAANPLAPSGTPRTSSATAAARALDDASHDLRNSLGAIGNAVHYLALVLPEDERFRKYLGLIQRELATTNRLVARLLDGTLIPPRRP